MHGRVVENPDDNAVDLESQLFPASIRSHLQPEVSSYNRVTGVSSGVGAMQLPTVQYIGTPSLSAEPWHLCHLGRHQQKSKTLNRSIGQVC
jgi:hypothetical protein